MVRMNRKTEKPVVIQQAKHTEDKTLESLQAEIKILKQGLTALQDKVSKIKGGKTN